MIDCNINSKNSTKLNKLMPVFFKNKIKALIYIIRLLFKTLNYRYLPKKRPRVPPRFDINSNTVIEGDSL